MANQKWQQNWIQQQPHDMLHG